MARRPRQASGTGYYHVVTRGNQRQQVFWTDHDYRAYCRLLAEAFENHDVTLSHFCLMPNHIHLLVFVQALAQLSGAMHQLQRRYWFYIRRRDRLTGHLWQTPFRSFPIQNEAYLLQAARYIERNPVAACLTMHPDDYAWSSYRRHALGQRTPLPLVPTPAYEALGSTPTICRKVYRTFVETPQPSDHNNEQPRYDVLPKATVRRTERTPPVADSTSNGRK